MADYLGEKDISEAIFRATEQIINENKYVTYDLGGNATLNEMTDKIAQLSANILRKYRGKNKERG
jgi:isocitrate dehydrogenase